MTENELIQLVRHTFRGLVGENVLRGIGDDAALMRHEPGEHLAITTDQVIEGTHFLSDKHPWDALGQKTVVRGLSDLAAIGAQPRWIVLSLGMAPSVADESWKQYITGLFETCQECNVPLVGGDVASAPQFSAAITAAGGVRGSALLRSGARPGDQIYVSGALGGSALGLEQLMTGMESGHAVERHWRPKVRTALGVWLQATGGATAAADISDGLSTDLAHIAESSGVGAVIEPGAVPRFPGASPEQALHGGEEYELVFTAPPDFAHGEHQGVRLTCIGHVESGSGVHCKSNGVRRPLPRGGFEHK